MRKQPFTVNAFDKIRFTFDASRGVMVTSAEALDIADVCQNAVANAVKTVGIKAGSVTLYDSDGNRTRSFISGSQEFLPMMKDLEERLISMLRNDFSVESLFLTFEKDCLYSLFSYPLIIDGENVGTISGVTVGKRNLATEEEFIRVVSS